MPAPNLPAAPPPQTTGTAVTGDNPIRTLEGDTLGRSTVARLFAKHVLALDVSQGVVVGVLGAWGSGKTSFVNLARLDFEKAGVTVVDFNPWMFSGAEQLVESFFIELAAQLRIRPGLAKVGKDLEEYGEVFSGIAWVPLVGPLLKAGGGAATLLGKILQRRKEGMGGRRDKLTKALINFGKPIVVVVDDIDRLSSSEIRDVFKLVRLTASFPNIFYVVAFDRLRVERALGEEGVPGREYLEKILQVAVDLPAIPSDVLNRQMFSAMDNALSDLEKAGSLDQDAWTDIFMEIIRPLVRHMRDVRRYSAAIRGTVQALEGQIALADVLALEAIRVFLPDVFRNLHSAVEGLTTTSPVSSGGREAPEIKAQIDGLMEAGGPHKNVVHDMIVRLFPAAVRHVGGSHFGADWTHRWLIERRVAHEDVLRLYLERVAGDRLQAFNYAELAWALMGDRHALDQYLRSIVPTQLEDVIAALEVYQDQFGPQHVVPGTIVLLNLLPDLPERQKGFFDLSTELVVTRVTYRLLRSLHDPVAVEAAVRAILPELTTLSAKDELISDVGYRENQGHKLVSEAAAAEFEKVWRDEVRAASLDKLLVEKDLLRALFITKRDSGPSEPPLSVDADPRLTLALLKAARHEMKTQTMGDRAVRRSPRLAWDVLVNLYGDDATLEQRIDELKATAPEGVDELIALADKYASGWRPDERDD